MRWASTPWKPTAIHAAFDEHGALWAESSNEAEVRALARPTDQVFRLWRRTEEEWRPVKRPSAEVAAEVEEYREIKEDRS